MANNREVDDTRIYIDHDHSGTHCPPRNVPRSRLFQSPELGKPDSNSQENQAQMPVSRDIQLPKQNKG